MRLQLHLQHRRPVGSGRGVRGLRHPGAQPGPGRQRGELEPRRPRTRPARSPCRPRCRTRARRPPARPRSTSASAAGRRQRAGRRARRRRLDHRHVQRGHPAAWAATASRRSSTRPTRSSSRTTPTTASPRRRQLVVGAGARPGPAGHRHHAPTRRTRRSARRSPSPSRSTTAAPARAARPRSPGVTVGGTTLNTNTGVDRGRRAPPTWRSAARWTATSGGATITATADATNVVAETNESNNTRSQSIVVGRGAAVPYTSYEAESGQLPGHAAGGRRAADVRAHQLRHRVLGPQVGAADQHRASSSSSPRPTQTNSIVVRNSIPDCAGRRRHRRRRSASTSTARSPRS